MKSQVKDFMKSQVKLVVNVLL